MRKVGVVSLGCSKNRIDSEVMMGYLSQDGYQFTPDPNEADIVIVNTCGFIESAKEESIDMILEMAQYKENGHCSALVVTGCLAQRYRQELQDEISEIDILIGVNEYEQLPLLLSNYYGEKEQLAVEELRYDRVLTTPKHYAYLRIAEGCDHHCSFCAIPAIRGPYQSCPMEELIQEAVDLRARGVEELIIIAQDISRYGIDLYGEKKLSLLLERLSKLDFKWIRLLYAYPEDIDEPLIDIIIKKENIVPYLDMPVQHVDNQLLKKMNRRGSCEYLVDLINRIREKNAGFILRTTFIVGFPGETDEAFQKLCAFVENNPIDCMGAFVYSPEDGTPAAHMPDQVPIEIAEKRRETLMLLQQKVSNDRLKKRVGQTYDVIVESYDPKSKQYIGRSYAEAPEIDGSIFIDAQGQTLQIGTFVRVLMIDHGDYDLMGKVVGKYEFAK